MIPAATIWYLLPCHFELNHEDEIMLLPMISKSLRIQYLINFLFASLMFMPHAFAEDSRTLKWNFEEEAPEALGNLMESIEEILHQPGAVVEGFRGQAITFGVEKYVGIRLREPWGETLTIRAWIKPRQFFDDISNYIFSACNRHNSHELLYGLRMINNRVQFTQRIPTSEGSTYQSLTTFRLIPHDKWSCITLVKSATATTFYIDGQFDSFQTRREPLPEADILYVGREPSNRWERGFKGAIDEVLVTTEIWTARQVAKDHQAALSDPIIYKRIGDTFYILLNLPQKDTRFANAPARVSLNLDYLRGVVDSEKPFDPEALTVVRWDSENHLPFPESVPHRLVDYDLYRTNVVLGWSRKEQEPATYAIGLRFDDARPEFDLTRMIPLIGAGEPVSVGRNDLEAVLGQGLAGYPSVVDWDGDGDLDLIMAFVIPRRVFLFENIANDPQVEPRLIRPRMIFEGASLLTHDLLQLPSGNLRAYTAHGGGHRLVPMEEEIREGRRILVTQPAIELVGLPEEAKIFDVAFTDYDQDGVKDLLVSCHEGIWWWPQGIDPWNRGQGNPSIGYGKGYDATNRWVGSPPIGTFHVFLNQGTEEIPRFGEAIALKVGNEPIRIETTQLAATLVDMNEDGLPDLLAAVDVDRILVFYNEGRPGQPEFRYPENALLETPVSKWSYFDSRFEVVDWDRDGQEDILMSSNPGLAVLCKIVDGKLKEEKILSCLGGHVWAEPLVVPSIVDFDRDGVWDMITGDCSGFLSLYSNTGTNLHPLFPQREKMKSDGQVFRSVAGYSGSIQGPNEARWGYLAPIVCDWDGDGLLDVVISDITGYVYWLWNRGTETQYDFSPPVPLKVGSWNMKVRWRTRPGILPTDTLPNLIMTDEEGYLALYRRDRIQGPDILMPGERLLNEAGESIKLDGPSGYQGRNKFFVTDWDRDGLYDLVIGQPVRSGIGKDHPFSMPREDRATIVWMRNIGSNHLPVYALPEVLRLANGERLEYGVHSCAPALYDVDGDGWDDVFIGAETGWIHYFHRSLFEDDSQIIDLP